MAHKKKSSIAAVPSRRRITSKFTLPSRAKQFFKDECDINIIMGKYRERGIIAHVNKYKGHYGHLGVQGDYHDHLNSVMEAESAFMSLPAKIRKEFNNDPDKFVSFVSDPDNQDEINKMGLGENPSLNNLKGSFQDPSPDSAANPAEADS